MDLLVISLVNKYKPEMVHISIVTRINNKSNEAKSP